ncbi:hypothetical protein D3C78_1306820 [compost metagenome]
MELPDKRLVKVLVQCQQRLHACLPALGTCYCFGTERFDQGLHRIELYTLRNLNLATQGPILAGNPDYLLLPGPTPPGFDPGMEVVDVSQCMASGRWLQRLTDWEAAKSQQAISQTACVIPFEPPKLLHHIRW